MSSKITIKTYEEFDRWVNAFMKPDGLNLVFVVSDPGNGKSQAFQAMLTDDHRYIKAGRLTAFQLYKQLYKFRNKGIILDDVEDALKRGDTVRLLMALCETDTKARPVAWFGSESMLRVKKGKVIAPGHWIENPFAPGVIHGMTNGVDEVGAEKLGQITLDLLHGSQDTTSHTWPPVEVRRFDTHILTGG